MLISQVTEALEFLKSLNVPQPHIGFVLGTGLNGLAEVIQEKVIVPYTEIPHFPVGSVAFHKGQLVFGRIGKHNVVAMQGRFHYYEGLSMQQITFPVRVMKGLGIEMLFLSNAAGGMNPSYEKGDLIIIEDHINLLPDNPLRGLGDEWGNRFVDMAQPYDPLMNAALAQAIIARGLPARKGVYVSVMGPNLETRAEYRWLRSMGADMVGMSTVPEVIVAAQLGIRTAAVSVITDECDPSNLKPVDISDIIAVAGRADKQLTAVMQQVMESV